VPRRTYLVTMTLSVNDDTARSSPPAAARDSDCCGDRLHLWSPPVKGTFNRHIDCEQRLTGNIRSKLLATCCGAVSEPNLGSAVGFSKWSILENGDFRQPGRNVFHTLFRSSPNLANGKAAIFHNIAYSIGSYHVQKKATVKPLLLSNDQPWPT